MNNNSCTKIDKDLKTYLKEKEKLEDSLNTNDNNSYKNISKGNNQVIQISQTSSSSGNVLENIETEISNSKCNLKKRDISEHIDSQVALFHRKILNN